MMNRRRNERRSVGTSNGERRRTACLPAAARYFHPRSNIRRKRGRIECRFVPILPRGIRTNYLRYGRRCGQVYLPLFLRRIGNDRGKWRINRHIRPRQFSRERTFGPSL